MFSTISPKRLLRKTLLALIQAENQGDPTAIALQRYKFEKAQKRAKRERSRKQLRELGINVPE